MSDPPLPLGRPRTLEGVARERSKPSGSPGRVGINGVRGDGHPASRRFGPNRPTPKTLKDVVRHFVLV